MQMRLAMHTRSHLLSLVLGFAAILASLRAHAEEQAPRAATTATVSAAPAPAPETSRWSLGAGATVGWINTPYGVTPWVDAPRLLVERELSRTWRLVMSGETRYAASTSNVSGATEQSSGFVTVAAGARRVLNPGARVEIAPRALLRVSGLRDAPSALGANAHFFSLGLQGGVVCEYALGRAVFARLAVDLLQANAATAHMRLVEGRSLALATVVQPALEIRLAL